MGPKRSYLALGLLAALSLGSACHCGENKITPANAPPGMRRGTPVVPPAEQKPFPTTAEGLPQGFSAPPPPREIVAQVSSASVAMYGTFYGRSKDPERVAAIKATLRDTGAEIVEAQLTYAKDCSGCHGENGKGRNGVPDLSRRKSEIPMAQMKKILIGPHADRPKASKEPTDLEVQGMVMAIAGLARGR
ncbi:MAG: c-type cytochrome [Myxococcota bacterium]